MKNQITRFLATLVAVLAWSSSVYAECTNAVFDGTWEVAFSDGNSCRLVFDSEGGVVANESICFDPFRGAAAPDSGTYAVASDCSATVALVVEGNTIDMAAHLASDLDIGAGTHVVSALGEKGSFTMIRVLFETESKSGITGSWYNPEMNGQGWVIEIVSTPGGEDQFGVYFYGYDDGGALLWLIGFGPGIDGNTASVDVLRTVGTGFGGNFVPDSFDFDTVGTMAFTFSDCNNATVSFTPVEGGDLIAFATEMTRLTNISSLDCSI